MQAKHTTAHSRPEGLRRWGRRLASVSTVLVVTIGAGLLFGISASNARHQGSLAETNLAGLVAQQQADVLDLEETVDELRTEQDELVESQIPAAPTQSGILALRGAMVGNGVTVTLDDAPADFQLDETVSVNDAVVHQQDVDAVMNALWRGGAEVMSVQDVRITSTTPVRCVGNVILVGARSFAPPYRITAIGDVDRMVAALNDDPSVRLYREDAARYQMGWDVTVADRITIPAASELSSLQFACIREGA